MRTLCLRVLAATLVAAALTANADTIVSRNINFAPTFGLDPDGGTFTYDVTTQQFTDLSVTWDTFTIDLSSAANSLAGGYAPCGGLSGGAEGYAIVTGGCTGPVLWWGLSTGGGLGTFDIYVGNPGVCAFCYVGIFGTVQTDVSPQAAAYGYIVIPRPIPEPATISLLGLGLASVGFMRRLKKQRIGV